MTADDQPAWAGFWRRVGAFAVDGLLLGLVGALAGAAAFDILAKLDLLARLIGLALMVGYFGVLGSRIGGGQTLGMRLFKLRIAGVDGQRLPLGRALGRAFILSLPFLLNGIALKSSDGVVAYGVVVLAATALFGLGLGQLYLLLFNRPSRRLVHDLLFGSVVLRVGSQSTSAPVAVIHRRVVLGIVLAVFVLTASLGVYAMQTSSGPIPALRSSLAAIEALPEVTSATVGDNTTVSFMASSGKSTTHARVINARLNAWPNDLNAEAERIAEAALSAGRLPPGWRLTVALNYGYNMGIASGSKSYVTSISPPAGSARALGGDKPG